MIQEIDLDTQAAWRPTDLQSDQSWIFPLNDKARTDVSQALKRAYEPEKMLFEYKREDFDFGSAMPVVKSAFKEAMHGRGVALLRGLPREGLSEEEFRVLSWAIGLHTGVGRPQGKATQYISAVRNVGTDYRSASGRGYSSSAKLDFHTDSADIVALSCYNQAVTGGMSMVTSSPAAYRRMAELHPGMIDLLHYPVHFSRQGEQSEAESPSYPHPIFDTADGRLFSRWNHNRVSAAQKLEGVPQIDPLHMEALQTFDELLRSPELMYTMYLQPGDVQLLHSHVNLHARTDFVDHEDPAKKRLLFRLWLSTPDSVPLPESWKVQYRSTSPGSVRGGIFGHQYDEKCAAFDKRQARALGMTA